MRIYKAYATVVRVIDGDSFHAVLDPGWGLRMVPRTEDGIGSVRVVFPDGSKYDAPEVSTASGKLARAAAQAIVHPGDVLDLISFHLDDFGRTLAAVTLPDGQDWATVMTAAGHVKVRTS